MTDKRLYWAADKRDQVDHAAYRGQHWTLCGKRATIERYAWPPLSRCRECERAATDAR